MAKRYTVDEKDLQDWLKVLTWSTASAILAVLISAIAQLDLPTQYAFLVPLVNTVLVALKDLLEDRIEA